jgi:hypothetical protein
MMLALLVLGQTMNLNVQPLLCMDEGAYCRADRLRAFELNCSGAGITCAQTGGRMTVTVAGGGGGSPTVSCVAGEALSWNGTTWLCVTNVATATALAANPAPCSAGQYVSDIAADGTLTCSTPAGGAGSGTSFEQSVTLTDDGAFFTQAVALPATTATSKFVCRPFGTTADSLTPEVIAIAGLQVTVADLVAGVGLNLHVYSPYGLTGTVRIHCTTGG